MKRINSKEDFLNEIKNTDIITNTIFEFPHIAISHLNDSITFDNCIFKTKFILFHDIHNKDLSITFRSCHFEGRLEVSTCSLYAFSIENLYSLEALYVRGGKNIKINNFSFKNDYGISQYPLDVAIKIQNYTFETFEFINIKHVGKYFRLFENVIGTEDYKSSFIKQSFRNSSICNALFSNNLFLENTSFFESSFTQNKQYWTNQYDGTQFYRNIFSNVNFRETNFEEIASFHNCTFNGRTNFHSLNTKSISNLLFNECNFSEHVDFEYATVEKLSFSFCIFDRTISYDGTSVEEIDLKRNLFNKSAYFNDFTIKKIDECGRTTLRTIKQELQKTDNKIDYNRFRAYELSAYYRELKWLGNSRDKFILAATWLATGFDYSWRRALAFTIGFGLFWYSIVYFFEFYFALNLAGDDNFMKGAFRFFLVTDFSSPFRAKGEFLENWGIWIPLVLGKIFIAFGIYEMIQAFRKFKA